MGLIYKKKNMQSKKFTLNLDSKDYIVEIWKLANQTNGSCTVQVWETVILATVCMQRKASDIDFLPLSVVYQEKFYASWMITSNRFKKREWRPADDKILTWRLIDRGLRPLFPKWLHNEIQLILTTLAYDKINEHDTVAWFAASVAFSISDIPFLWPNILLRIWMIDWAFILNPTVEQVKISKLDLLVTCTKENIVMIEAWADIISEEKILEAMEFAFEKWKKICEFIEQIAKEIWKEKVKYEEKIFDERILPEIESNYSDKIKDIIFNWKIWKLERFSTIDDLKEEAVKIISEKFNSWEENSQKHIWWSDIKELFWKLVKDIIRKSILEDGKRIKWRAFDEIRPLHSEVWIIPRVHWSWLFQRWETQWLSIVTLWWPWAKQIIEWIEWESESRYYHHYNFPPFSVWEVSNKLTTWNREIWHWALAERALLPVIPSEENFPYVIRVVTEILSSNWSSSMASVCGSTLSLMDAWVPIKKPVAWIAMWLMTDSKSWKYKILTDLQDEEDFWWDMDFKVAWTEEWITAIQMDIKLTWIPMNIFKEAFSQAKKWRLDVLKSMLEAIKEPRENLSKYAPKLISMKIDKDDIKVVIWKWWDTINKIIKETWVKIDISDEWDVVITAESWEAWDNAMKMIKALVQKPEIWMTYDWIVKKTAEFWAFVEFLPWTEWLVHISMISDKRIKQVEDVLKVWEKVRVKIMEKDNFWRYKLSIKDAV